MRVYATTLMEKCSYWLISSVPVVYTVSISYDAGIRSVGGVSHADNLVLEQ